MLPALIPDRGHGRHFPRAPPIPVTVNGGAVMPAWYDILGLYLQRRMDEDGVRLSAERISAHLARGRARGIKYQRTILAEFSQGGAIALHLGLRHPERLAGVMALSTDISFDNNLDESAIRPTSKLSRRSNVHTSISFGIRGSCLGYAPAQ